MKAEHRKELQTNELADWLGKTVDTVKGGNRSWTIGAGVGVLVVVVIGVYVFFLSSSGSATPWNELSTASDLKALEKIAADNANTKVGRTARFEIARMLFNEGIRDLAGVDVRASAIFKLQKARELYETLINDCRDNDILQQEAMMWTARAEESLIGTANPDNPALPAGSIDKAIEYYQKLADKTPETFATKEAAERAKALQEKKPQIDAFYAKLNEDVGKLKK